jgi:hypothetical protein
MNKDPMLDVPTHITDIRGRLLSNQQHEDIRQLATVLEQAEVTDKRAQALSIVRPRLFGAKRAMERACFDHGGINCDSILSSSYISSFLGLRERSRFSETSRMMWRGPDDSKEEPDILGNRPHSTK